MNINSPSIRQCTSCSMCAAVCPKDAIDIKLDNEGFYRPIVNYKRCVDCGLCIKVCYKFDKSISLYGEADLAKTTLYAAWTKNEEEKAKTTSGGIADLLARQLINEGYKCVGVVYDGNSDCAVDIVADNAQDIKGFRGSKYIQSYTYPAFKEIVAKCRDEKYAVFGTPCHIYALDKYLRLRNLREKFVLVDLYCHGCPSMYIWRKYIKKVKQTLGVSSVDYVNFRSKKYGWGGYFIVVVVDGKPVYFSDKRNDSFYELFFSDQILNSACNDCRLRSTLAYTDIRLGDFWGKKYVLNSTGVSAVSVVSLQAQELFERIKDKIHSSHEHYEDFLPWQSWGKVQDPNIILREDLFNSLNNEAVTLEDTIKVLRQRQSLKTMIKRMLQSVLKTFPYIEKRIRWIYYKI